MEPITTYAGRGLAIGAATLLVGASAGFGVAYAWTTAAPHGFILAAIAVAMALGLEIAKPFAVHGVFTSLRAWRIGQAIALGLVALLAVAYSLTAELTFQAMMRGDMVAGRGAEADDRRSLEAKAARIQASIAGLPKHRPAAVVDAAVLSLAGRDPAVWGRTRGCTAITARTSAEACRPALALQGELVAAKEAARMEGELTTVREELAKTGGKGIGSADPGASALAAYAVALGFMVEANGIAPWLPLIAVLALEIGAAFAGVLVASGGREKSSQTEALPVAIAETIVALQPADTPALAVPRSSPDESSHARPAMIAENKSHQGMGTIPAPSDPVAAWAKDRLAGVRKGSISMVAAHADCQAWCANRGLPLPSGNAFGRAMTAALKTMGGKRAKRGGIIHYRGVALTTDGTITATSDDSANGEVLGRFAKGENPKVILRSKGANHPKITAGSSPAKASPNAAVSRPSRNAKRRALGSSPLNGKNHANGHALSTANGIAHPIAN